MKSLRNYLQIMFSQNAFLAKASIVFGSGLALMSLLFQTSVLRDHARHEILERLINQPTVSPPPTTTTTAAAATTTIVSSLVSLLNIDDKSKNDTNSDIDPDANCPFRDSPLYRSIYVYPSPGEERWKEGKKVGIVLENQGTNSTTTTTLLEWPWIEIDQRAKRQSLFHYDRKGPAVQYATELLVRDIITHPDSCLQTDDPEKASLFYVPYLPSTEYHKGYSPLGDYQTSPYGQAILDILDDGNYTSWETLFGLTSTYWKRRNGSDHILVFSEPMHGLWHPRSKRGNFHFINSQKQLSPPIVISVELSKTFVEMYPQCSRKNILMPYPNTDGDWFNGKYEKEAREMIRNVNLDNILNSPAALNAEKELMMQSQLQPLQEYNATTASTDSGPRPLTQYLKTGIHGSCRKLRQSILSEFQCTPSGNITKHYLSKQKEFSYVHAYRQSTFCPCPGGDSPSAKRMFDAIFAGCIPVVLSEDFVWPFTKEFDPFIGDDGGGDMLGLEPSEFSLRLNSQDFVEPKVEEKTCHWTNPHDSLQGYLERITPNQILQLKHGLKKASEQYAYYEESNELPDNPLREGVLPTGGAAHALVNALAQRSKGIMWPACQLELEQLQRSNNKRKEPTHFKC